MFLVQKYLDLTNIYMYSFLDVVNGEKNSLTLLIENNSDRNVTLRSAAGSFHDVASGKTLKNVRANSVHVPNLILTFPFSYHMTRPPLYLITFLSLKTPSLPYHIRFTASKFLLSVIRVSLLISLQIQGIYLEYDINSTQLIIRF
jgi:hypothetical protein